MKICNQRYTSLTDHRWRFAHLTLRCLMKRHPYDVLALPLILEKAKGWEEGEERMLGLHLLEFTENLIFRFLQSDEWTGEQKLQYGDIQYGEIPKDIEFSKPLTAPTYLNYGTQANTTGEKKEVRQERLAQQRREQMKE
ncbi:hypothetical protein Tco_0567391 [Tanacetum coccineum]